MKTAIIIPIKNGLHDLERLVQSLARQHVKCDVLMVDSGSVDGTLEFVANYSEKLEVIAAANFNHGGTRQLMVDRNPEYDIYIFMTQDACLQGADALDRICAPFSDPSVAAVCGRQLPHLDATPFAQHARYFSYPSDVQMKTMDDVARLGIRTAFMSNSFAAYRGTALKAVGGFPRHVIFAEDMYVAAKMLIAGWKVVYAGNAECRHSHNYSIMQEFRRYFDMGVFHAREPWIRQQFGGAGGEVARYVRSELRFLGWRRIYLWPEFLLRNAVKLFGYKLGQQERLLPIFFKRKIGMFARYWDSEFAVFQHSSSDRGKS